MGDCGILEMEDDINSNLLRQIGKHQITIKVKIKHVIRIRPGLEFMVPHSWSKVREGRKAYK